MIQTFEQLQSRLPAIQDIGFIKTHRAGNTGVGKTLEDLLGIEENNFSGPNGHETELKSTRKQATSMTTLFTKSPLPKGVNTKLVKKLGRPENGRNVLHTTVRMDKPNTLYGNPGFVARFKGSLIELYHPEYDDSVIPFWREEDLEKAFLKKYPKNLLYVKADHRGSGADEEFHYNEAWLMSGFSFRNFVELLKKGVIRIDIRIGQYANGKTHDHGTGFRVFPDKLDSCFEHLERIL